MAQELDPTRLKCNAGHGRPVVGFATQGPDEVAGVWGDWFACCPICLVDLAPYDHFVYVRFRDDPAAPADTPNDTANHANDDPALKYGAGGADNNGPG